MDGKASPTRPKRLWLLSLDLLHHPIRLIEIRIWIDPIEYQLPLICISRLNIDRSDRFNPIKYQLFVIYISWSNIDRKLPMICANRWDIIERSDQFGLIKYQLPVICISRSIISYLWFVWATWLACYHPNVPSYLQICVLDAYLLGTIKMPQTTDDHLYQLHCRFASPDLFCFNLGG
jgi:hypothetical protein